MAYRELEVSLLSAQDLKSVNLITRMNVYAVVSISGDPLTRQCTAPDTYGGRNPIWNATFRFAVPPTSAAAAAAGASLHVLLRAERFLGDRDVGEVVVPLADVLAGAAGVGPQPPQVASYQVRKLHRWEPRGVLHVSYRLGPVVAPVVERGGGPDPAKATVATVYAPVDVPPQPSRQHHPPAVAYQQPPPAPGPPAGRVVAEHDEAVAVAQKSPVVMAYPAMGVQQQASKQDAYRPPPPPPPPPRPAARQEEAPAAAAPPTPPPTNARSNGLGQPGPTHIYMGPHTQIIFSAGPPTRTTSPARSTISPAGSNWTQPIMSVTSPRSRKEDRWRPCVLSQSQSQHDTQQQQQPQKQGGSSSTVAAAAPPPPSQRLAAAASSPFSSRSSSFSSPLSPYSSAHSSPSSSVHSSTRSLYSAHPSTAASPHPPPAEVTRAFRSASSRGAVVSSPLPSSSPLVPHHSNSSVVPSL